MDAASLGHSADRDGGINELAADGAGVRFTDNPAQSADRRTVRGHWSTGHMNRDKPDDVDNVVKHRLHELAERLWASSNYVQALRARLQAGDGAVAFADSAIKQLDLAVEEFQRLRDLLGKR